MDAPSTFVGTDFEQVYWTMVTPFVGMIGDAMDILSAMLDILVARTGEQTEQEKLFKTTWWRLMGMLSLSILFILAFVLKYLLF